MKDDGFWGKLLKGKNAKTNIITVFLSGVIIMAAAGGFSPLKKETVTEKKSEEQTEQADKGAAYIERELEKRLEQALSQAEGVGAVKVMLTLSSSEEKILATQTRTETSNNGETSLAEETIVLSEGDDGNLPIVVTENMPKIEGALIIAEGGNNAVVKEGIINTAEALLGVPSHKVQVLKMK